MKKISLLLLFIYFTVNSFTMTFLDPAINRILIYVDKDGANNYAFINGISEEENNGENKFLSLGVAGSSLNSRLNDKNDYTSIVPLINLKYNRFYSYGGIYNGYNFYDGGNLELNVTAEYRFSGHVEDDFDSYLKELDDVDNPIMLGIGGSYKLGYVILTSGISHNVRGTSDENSASVGLLSGIPFKKFILIGYMSYELMTNSYADKHFGIADKTYISPSVVPYEIDGVGQAFRVTTALAYSLSRHIDLFTYYSFEILSDNIKDSTLIKGDNSHMVGLGATYTF
jgi:outer membrane scaffolding protein for murein synthesis (MipA/OmpV family)